MTTNCIDSEFVMKRILSNEDELENTMKFAWDEIIDEVILGLAFEVHHDVKLGILFLDETDE
uniref:Uncharacterized protein n=1 Tax=Strigamia maritima TaxID=126957 RepID=T1J6Z8_STRMM